MDPAEAQRFADRAVLADGTVKAQEEELRKLAKDPLLEAAFRGLEHDDRQEFAELQEAFKQACVRGKLAVVGGT